jgi:biotin carboxylase
VTRLLLVSAGAQAYREYSLRSLAAAYDVWLFGDREPGWERPYLAGHAVLDTTDPAAMLAAAADLGCAGVLTWDDTRAVAAAEVATALGLPTSPPAAVLCCRDKHRTRTALAAAGVPQARSALVTTVAAARAAAAELGYPVVLKPRALNASIGVVRVDAPDQLARRFRLARTAVAAGVTELPPGDVLVEEYLEGPEISVDAGWRAGRPALAFVARKQCGFPPYFEEVGHVVDAADPLAGDPRLREVVAAAHAAVGFTTGWTHTEVRLTAGGPKIVEINPRLGGDRIPDVAGLAFGVDAALAAAAVACGQPVAAEPTRRRVAAIRFLYPPEDCIVRAVRVHADRLPAGVAAAVPLALPGQQLRLPPAGHVSGRYALVTAAGETGPGCLADLDAAAAAIDLEVLPGPVAVR